MDLPTKLSGFQSLSHVWAWYNSPLAEAGGLSPNQLEQRYRSDWRSGRHNRKMWCYVLSVVRAVQQRVGSTVRGSHRGAQLDQQQIVQQLDAERGAMPVASYIRKHLKAQPGEVGQTKERTPTGAATIGPRCMLCVVFVCCL